MNTKAAIREGATLTMQDIPPDWWHLHGLKMKVREPRKGANQLVITGSAASLIIAPAIAIQRGCGGWSVEWRVVQDAANDEAVIGRRMFSHDELKMAFGISNDNCASDHPIVEKFKAQVAGPGKYIRFGKYLNIPCPGCGYDGDPNVSIYINDEIRKAVELFIG